MRPIIAILLALTIPTLCSSQPVIVTPDPAVNRALTGKPLSEIEVLRTGEVGGAMILDPVLPSDWGWLAGRGLPGKKGPIEFFIYHGNLYTNSNEPTVISYRTRRYPELFTDRIRSNVFVIGFQKEDEGLVFAASDRETTATIVIEKSVFHHEVNLQFPLQSGEGRLIRILRRYPPYRP